jgi:hypothetical protein
VADDGVADSATDHEAHEGGAGVVVGEQVHHEGVLTATTP